MFNQKIQDWFIKNKWEPHSYQLELFKKIDEINNALILAPTGSGKTLAGFLPSINEMIVNPKQGLNTLYISPLKFRQKAKLHSIYLDQWYLSYPLQ